MKCDYRLHFQLCFWEEYLLSSYVAASALVSSIGYYITFIFKLIGCSLSHYVHTAYFHFNLKICGLALCMTYQASANVE